MVSKDEILKIIAVLQQAMHSGTIGEILDDARTKLVTHKMQNQSGDSNQSISNKELEICIEILIQHEMLSRDTSFFKRTELREKLISEYM